MRKLSVKVVAVLSGLASVFAVGLLLGRYRWPAPPFCPPPDVHQIRESRGGLVNPLLDCEQGGVTLNMRELPPFMAGIETVIDEFKGSGLVTEVSVYYRDLNNGPWYGIREQEPFIPGSLYKVPVIIACLKMAEDNPDFLRRSIRFEGLPDPRLGQYHFLPAERLEVGKSYTVEDLIHRTAAYSDNGSAYLLRKILDQGVLDQVFSDLGIDASVVEADPVFSASSFGRFFRILFNASYLSREMSEKALSYFTGGSFTDGIVAGLPPGTVVAHKHGEYMEGAEAGSVLQLHDTGIVYLPGNPYLLCVMTRGTSYQGLTQVISTVSRLIFEQVGQEMSRQAAERAKS